VRRASLAPVLTSIAFASLVACGTTDPKEPYDQSAAAIQARLGQRVHWNQGTKEDEEVAARVHQMLQHELVADACVQIALVNNPSMQATFEELRIAQADLVQAGLLKNPSFSLEVLFPPKDVGAEASNNANIHGDVTLDFLGIFMIPAKKRIARAELEAAEMRVGNAAVNLAYDTRAAFHRVVAANQVLAMRRIVIEAGEAAVTLARQQNEAGNLADLDLATEEATYAQLVLDRSHAESEVLEAREALTRLMGVWGPDTEWKVIEKIPELPLEDPPLEHLESLAVARRFDLAAARHETEALSETIAMVKNWRLINGSVGAGAERTHEGGFFVGPAGSLEIPLFDQKQAVIARLEGMMNQARARESDLAIAIRSEVRSARSRLIFARGVVEQYTTKVVPAREKVVALSQEQYDAMLLGVYQLLLAKQNEVNAYRELIEAARDYWIALADLERSVGGKLEAPTPKANAKTITKEKG
jgi:cobalt-zinc-cadmium efflux system outer membrane protein